MAMSNCLAVTDFGFRSRAGDTPWSRNICAVDSLVPNEVTKKPLLPARVLVKHGQILFGRAAESWAAVAIDEPMLTPRVASFLNDLFNALNYLRQLPGLQGFCINHILDDFLPDDPVHQPWIDRHCARPAEGSDLVLGADANYEDARSGLWNTSMVFRIQDLVLHDVCSLTIFLSDGSQRVQYFQEERLVFFLQQVFDILEHEARRLVLIDVQSAVQHEAPHPCLVICPCLQAHAGKPWCKVKCSRRCLYPRLTFGW